MNEETMHNAGPPWTIFVCPYGHVYAADPGYCHRLPCRGAAEPVIAAPIKVIPASEQP